MNLRSASVIPWLCVEQTIYLGADQVDFVFGVEISSVEPRGDSGLCVRRYLQGQYPHSLDIAWLGSKSFDSADRFLPVAWQVSESLILARLPQMHL